MRGCRTSGNAGGSNGGLPTVPAGHRWAAHLLARRVLPATALPATALLATALLATACSGGRPPAAAASRGGPAAVSAGADRRALAARYLAIAAAGNRHLEADFDGLEGRDSNDLARARADLRDAAATEHLFDRRLHAMVFPPGIEQTARALEWLNESRATLTARAAASRTLAELHACEPQLLAANAPLVQAVTVIRAELGLPPPKLN